MATPKAKLISTHRPADSHRVSSPVFQWDDKALLLPKGTKISSGDHLQVVVGSGHSYDRVAGNVNARHRCGVLVELLTIDQYNSQRLRATDATERLQT